MIQNHHSARTEGIRGQLNDSSCDKNHPGGAEVQSRVPALGERGMRPLAAIPGASITLFQIFLFLEEGRKRNDHCKAVHVHRLGAAEGDQPLPKRGLAFPGELCL